MKLSNVLLTEAAGLACIVGVGITPAEIPDIRLQKTAVTAAADPYG